LTDSGSSWHLWSSHGTWTAQHGILRLTLYGIQIQNPD
jgi:hypothetical protein